MLIELYPHFELILFTKGSFEYAWAFNKALHKYYMKSKYARADFIKFYAKKLPPTKAGRAATLSKNSPVRALKNLD